MDPRTGPEQSAAAESSQAAPEASSPATDASKARCLRCPQFLRRTTHQEHARPVVRCFMAQSLQHEVTLALALSTERISFNNQRISFQSNTADGLSGLASCGLLDPSAGTLSHCSTNQWWQNEITLFDARLLFLKAPAHSSQGVEWILFICFMDIFGSVAIVIWNGTTWCSNCPTVQPA